MRITNLKDIRAAVWAGIGYLNVKSPGWQKKVNLRRLDLSNPQHCVLGEVFGTYVRGKNALGLTGADSRSSEVAALGFYLPVPLADDGSGRPHPNGSTIIAVQYNRLTAEWRAAYRASLKAQAKPSRLSARA